MCLLAAIWALVIVVTGGAIMHIGAWRLSSRNPANPLLLSIASGLIARWLSRNEDDDEGVAVWRWWQAHFPVLLVAAAAFEVLVILRPAATGVLGYPLAVPDVFTPPPPLKPFALPPVLLAGAAVLTAAATKGSDLFARPRRTLAAVFLLGLALHFAMLGSLKQGLPFFAERAISSGHGIFLYEAVALDDLGATLEQYEPLVRRHVYLSVKGPGILVLFRGLNIVANSAVVRPLLAPLAPSAIDVPPWLIEWGFAPGTPHAEQTLEEMRYLLALMFVLYPVLTMLPVFFVFWVASVFVDDTFGLIAAMTFIVTPEAHLSFSHLDFSLFPLLAIGTVAPFVVGVRQQRLRYVAASAVVFTVYFSITLAAVSVVMMLVAWLGIEAWQRLRRRESPGRVGIEVASVSGVFGLVSGLMLAAMYVGIHFHPVERYSYARLVQRDWVTSDYNLDWVMANALGYFISFGLVQTGLLLAQSGRAAWRVSKGTADGIGSLAVAWLGLVLFLLAFGRQHGETNRLWTFLTPVGCLIVARYIYDVIPRHRWWLPMSLFFASLMLMRSRLNYF